MKVICILHWDLIFLCCPLILHIIVRFYVLLLLLLLGYYVLFVGFINYRYVSRLHVRDSSKHVILGTQQYKPNEFATQINLNMDNAWGILRCIIDICMKQKDGKYLIMKDPNKVCFFYCKLLSK